LSTFRNGTTVSRSTDSLRSAALDVPVDRVLEQDGADDALAGEAGLVMMRVRIWCTIANISASLDHAFSLIP